MRLETEYQRNELWLELYNSSILCLREITNITKLNEIQNENRTKTGKTIVIIIDSDQNTNNICLIDQITLYYMSFWYKNI